MDEIKQFLKECWGPLLFFLLWLLNRELEVNYLFIYRDYPFFGPFPTKGMDLSLTFVISLFYIVFFIGTLKKSKLLTCIINLIFIYLMLNSVISYKNCIDIVNYRIDNIENTSFKIEEVDIDDINRYIERNERQIIMISSASCPYCEIVYSEIEQYISQTPVSIKYFDCYSARNHSSDKLDQFLNEFQIEEVPVFLILEYEDYKMIYYSDNMIKELNQYVQNAEDKGRNHKYYFTNYKDGYYKIYE